MVLGNVFLGYNQMTNRDFHVMFTDIPSLQARAHTATRMETLKLQSS